MERYTRQVFYYETDKMAIVHNANYLRIFEETRLFFMEQWEVPYPAIEEAGILIPQVDAYVRYHQTLKYGDVFCADAKLTEYNSVRIKLEYELRRQSDEKLIATGFTSHCFLDEKTRVPLSLKRRFPDFHEKFLAAVSKS